MPSVASDSFSSVLGNSRGVGNRDIPRETPASAPFMSSLNLGTANVIAALAAAADHLACGEYAAVSLRHLKPASVHTPHREFSSALAEAAKLNRFVPPASKTVTVVAANLPDGLRVFDLDAALIHHQPRA